MTQHSYARISDSLLDIFNATEIGTASTLRDDNLSTSAITPFGDFEGSETYNTMNTRNDDTGYLDEDDDPVEQQQFHRISGILSQLIREASNAINSTPSNLPSKHTAMNENADDKPQLKTGMASKSLTSIDTSTNIMEKILSTYTTTSNASPLIGTTSNDFDSTQQPTSVDDISPTSKESRRRSRLPRPKKLSLESFAQHFNDHQLQQYLQRNRALSNASSTVSSTTSTPNLDEDTTLFSPVTSSLTTPMSRTISPLFLEKEHYSHHHTNTNYDVGPVERDSKAKHRSQAATATDNNTNSLTDSFERLDSSLAKVDTLSRDLANYRRKHPRSSNVPHTSGAQVPPPASTFISSDNNIAANQHHHHQHQPKKKGHSDGKTVLLMLLPFFYIPYLLLRTLWEKWDLAATVASTTPLDLLSSTIASLIFGGDSNIPRVLVSSSTATQIIPLSVGLSVYTLFMVILRLLMTSKSSSGTLVK